MSGKHRWVVWALMAAFLWLGGLPAWAAERRVALVIGNAQYQRGGAIPAAGANAGVVADALRRAGFEVTTANNLEHRGLVAALSRFQQALSGADLGFVYYTGLTLGMGGKGFVVPVNAKLASENDVGFDTIELDFLLQQVQGAKQGTVVVVDPVVPNPLADRLVAAMGPAGRTVSAVPGTPPVPDDTIIVYSQRPGVPPVPSRGGAAGPFAALLAQEMARPGAELRDALALVEREVAERTRGAQRPWVQDRLDGDILLVPAFAAAPPAPVPTQPQEQAPPSQAPSPQTVPEPPRVTEPAVEPLAETYVVTRDTNLREAPNIRSPVLRTLRRDSTVAVTGRVKGGGWLRVETEGQTGFASASNLGRPARQEAMPEPDADAAARPPPVAQAPSPGSASPGAYTVTRPVTLFTQPTLGARGVRELEAGAPVTVLEIIPGTNWVHVRDRLNQEGYVSAGALAPEKGVAQARGPEPRSAQRAPEPLPEVPLAGSGSSVAALPPDRPPAKPQDGGSGGRTYRPDVEEARRAGQEAAAGATEAAGAARRAEERGRQAQQRAQAAAEAARRGAIDPRLRVQRFPNGDVYEGEWVMGSPLSGGLALQRSGYGVYRFANGLRYEGEWRNDTMSGDGVLLFGTGDRYDGTFRNNQPDGHGVFRYLNGDVYAGEVRRNRPDGLGVLNFGNGDRYEGRVEDRNPNGFGTLVLSRGDRHVGRFRGGIQDGPGVAIFGGTAQPGVWRGATKVGE